MKLLLTNRLSTHFYCNLLPALPYCRHFFLLRQQQVTTLPRTEANLPHALCPDTGRLG